MEGHFEIIQTKDGPMQIYLSGRPSSPVVIVLQEAFGVNHHIRSVCDRFGQEGFYAAAPEIFHRLGSRIEIPYGDRKHIIPYLSKLSNEEIVQDISSTIKFLKNEKGAKGEVSTIGFCMGGFSSVLAATRLPIQKMISFYGAGLVHPREGVGLTPIIYEFKKIKADCLFFFGSDDVSIPMSDIEKIRHSLERHQINHEIVIFQHADHGFFCDERKTYHQEVSKIAWSKVMEFLRLV